MKKIGFGFLFFFLVPTFQDHNKVLIFNFSIQAYGPTISIDKAATSSALSEGPSQGKPAIDECGGMGSYSVSRGLAHVFWPGWLAHTLLLVPCI